MRNSVMQWHALVARVCRKANRTKNCTGAYNSLSPFTGTFFPLLISMCFFRLFVHTGFPAFAQKSPFFFKKKPQTCQNNTFKTCVFDTLRRFCRMRCIFSRKYPSPVPNPKRTFFARRKSLIYCGVLFFIIQQNKNAAKSRAVPPASLQHIPAFLRL